MTTAPDLLLIGASVRAVAFSALRAGLRPWCADLFADTDLRCCCPCTPVADYPGGLRTFLEQAPPAPWLYTGGLENHPALVGRIARLRHLWGNGPDVLERIRSPWEVAAALHEAGLVHPRVVPPDQPLPTGGRWLRKPVHGAGGNGIRFWDGHPSDGLGTTFYLQQFVDGLACSAVYLGNQGQAQLLGATRQLVGETWLHAGPFRYCGSIGPLILDEVRQQALKKIGGVLARRFGIRGLFGVDGVLAADGFYPVEVNPRYPASVEVLEYATGTAALALHRTVFDPGAASAARPAPPRGHGPVVGKAILYAPAALTFPEDGPWRQSARGPGDLWSPPAFADVPCPGTRIEAGHPILTVLDHSGSEAECLAALRRRAGALLSGTYFPGSASGKESDFF